MANSTARLGDLHQILAFCGAIVALNFLVFVLMLLLWWGAGLLERSGDNGRVLRLLLLENLKGDLPSLAVQSHGQTVRYGGI